jgi:hypothetical protein
VGRVGKAAKAFLADRGDVLLGVLLGVSVIRCCITQV